MPSRNDFDGQKEGRGQTNGRVCVGTPIDRFLNRQNLWGVEEEENGKLEIIII